MSPSLSGVLSFGINAVVVLALLGWLAAVLGFLPRAVTGPVRERITEVLRGDNVVFTLLKSFGAYAVIWLIVGMSGAGLALLIITFVVPLIGVWYGAQSFAPAALSSLSGLMRSGEPAAPDSEHFALPMASISDHMASDIGWFDTSVKIPRRSLLVVGSSGSGKSKTLRHFVAQSDLLGGAQTVVYDHKNDYEEFLRETEVPYVRLSPTENDEEFTWNVFRECRDEADIEDFATGLFTGSKDSGGSGSGSGSNSYWDESGADVLAASMKYLRRSLDDPDNADLVEFWNSSTEDIHEMLSEPGMEDLSGIADDLDPNGNNKQASSIVSTARRRVSRLFRGDFGRAGGTFSVREYFEEPEAYGVLLISNDPRRADTAAPVFATLIDQAIMSGLHSERESLYFLDEIEHMPARLRRLGELINVGRGERCSCILSLQSVAQLYARYGRDRGEALLSGMATRVILRTGDKKTADFAKSAIGTHVEERTTHVERQPSMWDGGKSMVETNRETRIDEESDFKGDTGKFEPGECIISRQGEGYVHGRVSEYRLPHESE